MTTKLTKPIITIVITAVLIAANFKVSLAQNWQTSGNATTSGNFLGTTNSQPLLFYTNNTQKATILTNGNVGIGTATPSYTLDVSGTGRFTGALTIGAYTIPSTDGTAGYVLSTNGSGTVNWVSPNASTWGLTGNSGTTVGTDFIGTTDAQALEIKVDGQKSGYIDYTGAESTSFGYKSLSVNSGNYNTAFGFNALISNTTGTQNTAIGNLALATDDIGSNNTAIGYGADIGAHNLSNATAIGYNAKASASNTVVIGNNSVTQFEFNGAFMPYYSSAYNAGTSGQVLLSSGAGAAPQWTSFSSINLNTWYLTGNSGTTPGTNFIGTTDAQPLEFKSNSQKCGYADYSSSAATTSFGYEALNANTGSYNTAFGYNALFANTTGTQNTAVGNSALLTNDIGTNNTAIGYGADVSAHNLTNATAIGYNAKASASNTVTIGNNSVTQFEFNGALMPYYSGAFNSGTSGQVLLSAGANAAPQWTSFSNINLNIWYLNGNTGTTVGTNFIGTIDAQPFEIKVNSQKSGYIDYSSAIANTSFGYQTLKLNTGTNNTANGYNSLFNNTTGSQNTAIGGQTLVTLDVGSDNTAIGYGADVGAHNITNSTAVGYNAKALVSNTVVLGNNSVNQLEFNGSLNPYYGGSYNAGSPGQVLTSQGPNQAPQWSIANLTTWNLTGNTGTTVGTNFIGTADAQPLEFKVNGRLAGYIDYTATDNTCFGYYTLYNNISGANNTIFGFDAFQNNTYGSGNTAIGYQALNNEAWTHGDSTYNSDNVAVGFQSLYSTTPNSSSTGMQNVGTGCYSLYANTTGSNNTAFGDHSSYHNTTGNQNTSVGVLALGTNDIGNNNTAIGYSADMASHNLSNSTAIGYNAKVTASNEVVIGNSAVTNVGSYAGWFTISDGRYKKDIQNNVYGLAFINKLKPVTYHLNMDKLNESIYGEKAAEYNNALADDIAKKGKILYSGFVAQDVEQAAKSIGYNFSGIMAPQNDNDHYSICYSDFVVPLVKAVQELSSQNDSLKNAAAQQQAINEQLQNTATAQQQQINDLKNQMQQFENALSQCCTSYQSPNNSGANGTGTSQNVSNNNNGAYLDQNMPNPFNENTIIKCYLPSNTQSAMIKVFNTNGSTIQTFNLSNTGIQQITISGNTLPAGNYLYSLIINGNIVDTKTMVLTR